MLFGFSGGVGTGKTLNAIKAIIENDNFAGRPVFYYGIRCVLLDYKVCDSFAGWFYGVYLPANQHNQTLIKKVLQIDEEQRLCSLDDFPYLAFHYKKHDPFAQWLHWFKKLASPTRLKLFKEALEVLELEEESITYADIEHLNLSWSSFDDPTEIQNLPRGSVVLVDEVQNIWPPRGAGKPMPESVEFVTTHRHGGYDLVYISQDFKDVDQVIRRRMQRYTHFEFLGGDYLHKYTDIQGFDPSNKAELHKAERTKVKRDNKYYGVYLSSIKHTQKVGLDPTIKKFLKTMSFVVPAALGIAYYLVGFFSETFAGQDEYQTEIVETEYQPTSEIVTSELSPEEDFFKRINPRVQSLPFSAPLYDSFTSEASTYPELICVIDNNACDCFTQQGSAYYIETESCISIARFGYFDPFTMTDGKQAPRPQKRKTELNQGGLY